MSRKTVPLSQIVDIATNEMQPSPNMKTFQTLVNIINTIPEAKIAIRVQLTNKMKSYCNGFLPKKAMYYTLCLADYLVKNCPTFRPQVTNSDFITLFERSAELNKPKRLSILKQNIVSEKASKMISSWSKLYSNDLYQYREMFEKYSAKGVSFPLVDDDDEMKVDETPSVKEDSPEDKLRKMTHQMKECDELINDSLQKANNTTVQIQAAKALYKRALELNSNMSLAMINYMNAVGNTTVMQKFAQMQNEFTSHMFLLVQYINNPHKADLYRAYSTGHMNNDENENETGEQHVIPKQLNTPRERENEKKEKKESVELRQGSHPIERTDSGIMRRLTSKRSATSNDFNEENEGNDDKDSLL